MVKTRRAKRTSRKAALLLETLVQRNLAATRRAEASVPCVACILCSALLPDVRKGGR